MKAKRGFQKAVGRSFSTLPRTPKHRSAQATKMAKKKWQQASVISGAIGLKKTAWTKRAKSLGEKI